MFNLIKTFEKETGTMIEKLNLSQRIEQINGCRFFDYRRVSTEVDFSSDFISDGEKTLLLRNKYETK